MRNRYNFEIKKKNRIQRTRNGDFLHNNEESVKSGVMRIRFKNQLSSLFTNSQHSSDGWAVRRKPRAPNRYLCCFSVVCCALDSLKLNVVVAYVWWFPRRTKKRLHFFRAPCHSKESQASHIPFDWCDSCSAIHLLCTVESVAGSISEGKCRRKHTQREKQSHLSQPCFSFVWWF